MQFLIERLSDALRLEVVEHANQWTICICKPAGLLFKVTIPRNALEWFVDAGDGSGTLWSEWADHYPVDGETREQLLAEMATSIEQFVSIVVKSKIRVSHVGPKSKKSIELEVDSVWRSASLSWMTAGLDYDSMPE